MRARLLHAVILAFTICVSGLAKAACAVGSITGISFTSTTLAPYNPFASFTPKLVTVTVTGSTSCTVELSFLAPTMPARMSGAGVLNYDVQLAGGVASLLYTGGNPLTSQPIVIGGPGNPGTATVQISIPMGQVVADGAYSDANLVAQVFDKTGSTFTLLRAQTMPVNGSVVKVCQFTQPTNPTLNFTSAIANGLPKPDHVRSLTLDGLSCTAPTMVRLSGNAMQPQQPMGNSPGFDSLIHYRASARFNAASALLDTSVASEASSTVRSTATGATVNGSMSIDVNLLAGNPLMAGTYGATLTISIDPSP
jgi:hypothetical protein